MYIYISAYNWTFLLQPVEGNGITPAMTFRFFSWHLSTVKGALSFYGIRSALFYKAIRHV